MATDVHGKGLLQVGGAIEARGSRQARGQAQAALLFEAGLHVGVVLCKG